MSRGPGLTGLLLVAGQRERRNRDDRGTGGGGLSPQGTRGLDPGDSDHGFGELGREDEPVRLRIIGRGRGKNTLPAISSPRIVSLPLIGPFVCRKVNTSPA